MILSQAMLLLRAADVRISGGNLDALSLTLPDSSIVEVKVQITDTPPTPSKLEAILERKVRTLIVTSRPTPALSDAAALDKVDLITVAPASVTIGGVQRLEPRPKPAPPAEKTHGRTPWGRWALLRAFALADGPWTQQELATVVGISQPAVNKHLKVLTSFVDRDQSGWKAHDVSAIVSWLTEHYPGPRGVSSYWYSLKSPAEQAETAAEFAKEIGASPLVSGDAAADIYAPWRLPDSVHLYLREAVDFTDAGFSPASKEEATLITTVPEDPTLWATALLVHSHGSLPLADPIVTLRDVLAGDAVDSDEAAEHLREAIVAGSAR
ncbi:ArsR/SmtB family transcription factor [Arthrobacter sp. Leaf337]|uniref:ArsR/SmtB family transcription factor n=1 Tax=Arthrobacter sp. Leaf337 TaxID=1736342 RepID=UPI000A54EB24|nr:winged helix-turn-helix transcriptional regulator [Arthrobacter sp. Leaf337]